jgi:hypothetical protein
MAARASASAAAAPITDEEASKLLQFIKIRVANNDATPAEIDNLKSTLEDDEKVIIDELLTINLDTINTRLSDSFTQSNPKIYLANHFAVLIPRIREILIKEAAATAPEAGAAGTALAAKGGSRTNRRRRTYKVRKTRTQ